MGTLLILLSLAWVQVREFTTDGLFGRQEVVEYGLPFGWIIYDSAAGWYVSLARLAASLFAAFSIIMVVHYVRHRMENAPG